MINIAQPQINDDEKDAVLSVLNSGQLAQGPMVHEFEKQFATWCGTKYAVATSSGTSALHIAMLAHGLGLDDEVITSPFSFIASANCALYVGAQPVFADIEPEYFTIDPESILTKITPKTKAIIPVHLYGQPCDMQRISKIAQEHNLIIVEDACQAHGAKYQGQQMGSWGTACYSFYPTKNMTTIEGGMITTNDTEIAERARLFRNHGSSLRYEHEMLGYNLRMNDLQAAIGLVQLGKIDSWNLQRKNNADYLSSQLTSINGIFPPNIRPDCDHVFHQYTIRIRNRDQVAQVLKNNGIGYGIHYPKPIHKQPLYQSLGYQDQLPIAESASQEVLSLPVHPALEMHELEKISATLFTFFQNN
jgi:perosamine synthetase